MKKTLLSLISLFTLNAGIAQFSTTGLFASYNFNTGTTIDGIYPQAHGTNVGYNVLFNDDRAGNPGASGQFDGFSSAITIGSPLKTIVNDGLTISAWIRVANTTGQKAIVAKWANSMFDDQYILMVDGAKLRFAVGKPNASSNGVASISNLSPNTWYHVAAVWNNTGLHKIFINGVADLTTTIPTFNAINNTSSTTLSIGAQVTNNSRYFSGGIDDVLLYDRSLDDSEILAIYNTPVNIPNGLVSRYPFFGNTADEQNYNNATGTGVTFTNDRFGNPSSALNVTVNTTHLNLHDSYDSFTTGAFGKVSYSFWVNFKNLNSAYQIILAKSADGGCGYDEREFLLRVNPSNQLELTAYGTASPGNYISLAGNTTLTANQWYHIVYAYDVSQTGSNKFKLYVNNALQTLSTTNSAGNGFTSSGFENAPSCIGVGGYLKSDSTFCADVQRLDAYFDDLYIYNKTLNANDVNNLYNEGDPFAIGLNNLDNKTQLNAFPNPFNNEINLNLESKSTVYVYSIDGKEMFTSTLEQGVNQINSQEWATGMYILKAVSEKGISSKKLIKQ